MLLLQMKMKFVFMFVNRIEKILFVHFFKIMKIVRTFQGIGFQKMVFIRRKRGGADLAADLSLGTIILIKKRFGRM